jgi:hypothetical protein
MSDFCRKGGATSWNLPLEAIEIETIRKWASQVLVDGCWRNLGLE